MASFVLKDKYEHSNDIIKIAGVFTTDAGKKSLLYAQTALSRDDRNDNTLVLAAIDALLVILKSKMKIIQDAETEARNTIPTVKYNLMTSDIDSWITGGMV